MKYVTFENHGREQVGALDTAANRIRPSSSCLDYATPRRIGPSSSVCCVSPAYLLNGCRSLRPPALLWSP
jgi:hypothetical protein